MLQLLGVKKKYFDRPVVSIDAQKLDRGFHWVRGPNGSGKSTLLKIIAGLLPFEGDILLDGISLKKNPLAYRSKISWAEAEPLYPAFLSGQELLNFYGGIRKAGKQELAELIGRFSVESYLSQATGTYSSGMLKRLSLLLAFSGKPGLIVLDEPLLTLDTGIADILPGLMAGYHHELGTSFVYSSHQAFPGDLFPDETIWEMADQKILKQ